MDIITNKVKIKNKQRLLKKFVLLSISNKNKKHFVSTYFSSNKKLLNNNYLVINKDLTSGTAYLDYVLSKKSSDSINLSNGDMMSIILKHLDLIEIVKVDKLRNYFKYKNFDIFIDDVKKIGSWLVVEITEYKDSKMAKKQIKDLLLDLGAGIDLIDEDYYQLLQKKR